MAEKNTVPALLIIFYRNPVLGKVKTRIAATLGDAQALAIYRQLAKHTLQVTYTIPVVKELYYSDLIEPNDIWPPEGFNKSVQHGVDLGERMLHAFEAAFRSGYQSVCIIGTDCYTLTTSIIEAGFRALEKNDVVLGPANDGGYYLLGMRTLQPALFENKQWSTATVAQDTLNDCERLGLSYSLLPPLDDVDTEADVPDELRKQLNF